MKISSGGASADASAVQRSSAAQAPEAKTAVSGGAGVAPASGALQSEVLQPAMAALAAMPEIDHDKVAQLRDALAKGELPFDPARLAGLITRFHGGQG